MAIIIYNPKYYRVNGRKTINTADIKNFAWSHAYWGLKAGEMKSFPNEVGEALLKLYEFLERVDRKNLDKVKAEISEKKFKCDKCDFETDTRVAYLNHYKTHIKQEEVIEGVEPAIPSGEFKGAKAHAGDMSGKYAEVPASGTTDKDNVTWYGEGLETDNPKS